VSGEDRIDNSAANFFLIIDASGLGLRNQPADIGEALSYDFDGKSLNPNGVEIAPPF